MVKTIDKFIDKNKIKTDINNNDFTYGLLFCELDSMYGERNFVLAYGELKKVKLYKEDCRLKGDIIQYKKQAWLVKKIESIKGIYKENVKLLFID